MCSWKSDVRDLVETLTGRRKMSVTSHVDEGWREGDGAVGCEMRLAWLRWYSGGSNRSNIGN